MAKIENKAISSGTKYVKKADLWVYFACFNKPNVTDIFQWFETQQEAEANE